MLPNLSEIRKKRTEVGLTQKELAKAIGLSQSFIAKIETEKVVPNYNLVRKIFHYLDMEAAKKNPKAKDFMSSNLVFVRSRDKLSKAIRLLKEFGFSQIPVIENGISKGHVTDSAVTKAILELGKSAAIKLEIKEIMKSPLSEIESHTPTSLIYELVINDGAVLVKEKGKIVGIITNSNLH